MPQGGVGSGGFVSSWIRCVTMCAVLCVCVCVGSLEECFQSFMVGIAQGGAG